MSQDRDDVIFTCAEKWLLSLVGLIFLAGAILAWQFPPLRSVAFQHPGAPGPNTPDTVAVSSDPLALVLLLLAAAMLFLFAALNGRRALNFKLPGGGEFTSLASEVKAVERALPSKLQKLVAEATTGQLEGEQAPRQPDATHPATTIVLQGVELGVYRVDDVPLDVLASLLGQLKDQESPPSRLAIEFVARRNGRGNHPWAIKFRGDERIWKLAYGGRGKSEPTLSLL
ncbi:MAG: hypothetical protein IT424_02085 [Pirellulales bacterium]|nr:hypothetical protein [Pirellulales bacterium]